jgi:hypothetical protein
MLRSPTPLSDNFYEPDGDPSVIATPFVFAHATRKPSSHETQQGTGELASELKATFDSNGSELASLILRYFRFS